MPKLSFKEHYLSEMPWIDGIDFNFEKSYWVDHFIKIVEKHKPVLNKLLDEFIKNEIYRGVFKKKFNTLNPEDKQKILNVLPDKFITDMGLQ